MPLMFDCIILRDLLSFASAQYRFDAKHRHQVENWQCRSQTWFHHYPNCRQVWVFDHLIPAEVQGNPDKLHWLTADWSDQRTWSNQVVHLMPIFSSGIEYEVECNYQYWEPMRNRHLRNRSESAHNVFLKILPGIHRRLFEFLIQYWNEINQKQASIAI